MPGKDAAAVAKLTPGGGDGMLLPLPVQIGHGGDCLGQLAPIGPGVHHHAAPQGARDPVGKLQPGQPPAQGRIGQAGQGDTALRPQAAVHFPGLIQAA